MIPFEKIFYLACYLIPAAIVSGFAIALQTLGSIQGREEIQDSTRFPLFKLFTWIQPKNIWQAILFTLNLSRFVYYLIFGFVSFHIIFLTGISEYFSFYTSSVLEISLMALVFIFLELTFTLIAERAPEIVVRLLSLPASLLLVPYLPLTALYFSGRNFCQYIQPPHPPKLTFKLQDKIIEYLSASEIGKYLDSKEKKLIHTVISFKDRLVREVMIPRIDIISLSSETTLLEATKIFASEGYSRIPVYKESVDKIVGVLLYKDIISIYTNNIETKQISEMLSKTVEHFVKPVLYTPETKKIAQLLQEFRNKHIHLAIVVDEYGGTEGIITIEDILEELVGNIEDEYDVEEEKTFHPLACGGWIVDAKMSILDVEYDLGIHIPNNAEYDTIGGYIFHRAGSIPSKGWKIHLDDIDLEVLKSDERSIRKIKITKKINK